MLPALAAALADLPADRPRYLMGVGDPASLVEAVALGVDQFDCVMQTRLGRHGTALTGAGKLHVKAARHGRRGRADRRRRAAARCAPATAAATCATCSRSASRPRRGCVSCHNVAWTLDLMARLRAAIVAGTLRRAARARSLAVWGVTSACCPSARRASVGFSAAPGRSWPGLETERNRCTSSPSSPPTTTTAAAPPASSSSGSSC